MSILRPQFGSKVSLEQLMDLRYIVGDIFSVEQTGTKLQIKEIKIADKSSRSVIAKNPVLQIRDRSDCAFESDGVLCRKLFEVYIFRRSCRIRNKCEQIVVAVSVYDVIGRIATDDKERYESVTESRPYRSDNLIFHLANQFFVHSEKENSRNDFC